MKKRVWLIASVFLVLLSFRGAPQYPASPGRSQLYYWFWREARAFLGVSIRELSESERKELGLEKPCCVAVDWVYPDSPAEDAGIRSGDVMVSVNGTQVEGVPHFQRLISEKKPGDTISLEVWRKKEKLTLSATLSSAPLGFPFYPPFYWPPYRGRIQDPGVQLYYLTEGLKEFFGVPNGVLVAEVRPWSAGKRAGLNPGDIILRVDNQNIYDPHQFFRILSTSPSHLLTINRRGLTLTLHITLESSPPYFFPYPYEPWYPYPYPYPYEPLPSLPEEFSY
ncbi:MAG: PDZ domain-containing protein [bacterium]